MLVFWKGLQLFIIKRKFKFLIKKIFNFTQLVHQPDCLKPRILLLLCSALVMFSFRILSSLAKIVTLSFLIRASFSRVFLFFNSFVLSSSLREFADTRRAQRASAGSRLIHIYNFLIFFSELGISKPSRLK